MLMKHRFDALIFGPISEFINFRQQCVGGKRRFEGMNTVDQAWLDGSGRKGFHNVSKSVSNREWVSVVL